jgi:branched-chain amino acid transport system ATP-binding protein
MTVTAPGLEGFGLTRRYGGLIALDQVNLTAAAGQVTAVIGPNGAGKTTLFECLAGAEPADAGRVLLGGADVTGLSAEKRARLGLARTFQRLAVFSSLTVEDNLRVGAEMRRPGSLVRGLLGLPETAGAEDDARVEAVLLRLGLEPVRHRRSGELPTGTQRLVELGRALCHDPSVLLLDEPASGLDTSETNELAEVLRGVASEGTAVLLVEHDMGLVLRVADLVYAMAAGRVLTVGTPQEVRSDPAVRAAYLERTGT